MNNRTYRMYGLVPYNISPIQQGIQFGHAVVEYGLEFFETPEYQAWARKDKTFMIMNGGTTNIGWDDNGNHIGTLNNYRQLLSDYDIQFRSFFEPDLGDQLTAVVFLVDDRVWNKVAWPDYDGPYYADMKTPEATGYYNWKMKFAETEREADQIVFMRDFLKQFRFA